MREQLENPQTTPKHLAPIIESDQGLARRLLWMVNAPYFEFNRKANTVNDAITLLGLNAIGHLMLAASVMRTFLAAGAIANFTLKEFWQHQIGVGVLARYLARKVRCDVENAFIAGMLHDLGKLVLAEFFAEALTEILSLMQTKRLTFYKAETELGLGTHCELGGYLAEKWHLDPSLVEAIRRHHNPGDARNEQKLVCIVHIANTLCKGLGIGFHGWAFEPELEMDAFERLELRASDVEKWLPDFQTEIGRAHELLALPL
jgi:putative nucleotidyltransferase with HDIG domain